MVASVPLHLDNPLGCRDAPSKKDARRSRGSGLRNCMWVARAVLRHVVRSRTGVDVWTELRADDSMDYSGFPV